MAIVEMRKITAIASIEDRERVMKTLVDFGVAEIRELSEYDNVSTIDLTKKKEEIESKLASLTFAIDYLKSSYKEAEKLVKKGTFEYDLPKKENPLLAGKITLSKEDFASIRETENEIFASVRALEDINKKVIELRSDITKAETKIQSLKPYELVDVPFDSFTKGKKISKVLGLVKGEKLQEVASVSEKYAQAIFECPSYRDNPPKNFPLAIIAPTDEIDAIIRELSAADFQKCDITSAYTAQEEIDRITKEEIAESKKEIVANLRESLSYYAYLDKFKILYDAYKIDYSVQEASETFKFTRRTFVFGFWTPKKDVETLEKKLEKSGIECYFLSEEPDESDFVPTLTENNAFVSPYECITNMYSVPSYREKDPNGIMSIFYFLLFGIMLGDAAYGLLLALGGFGLYLLKKPKKGEGKMLLIIGMGGISTAIWGFLFGSWFGITPNKSQMWYWFSPLQDPLKMLVLSLAVGFVQIVVGMFLQSLKMFREHKPLEAIFNVYGWYVVFIGIGTYAVDSFLVKVNGLSTAGLITALVGVGMLLVGGALGKNKKFFSRILGGFKNLYGVTNILSDVLSYARLFGLGLATGVVAMVVNQICSVIRGLMSGHIVLIILSWIISIVIYVIGHVFNLAINTLGTYVHNCRLQYVEFYGRFYDGGGRIFKPLGSDKKYTYVENVEK